MLVSVPVEIWYVMTLHWVFVTQAYHTAKSPFTCPGWRKLRAPLILSRIFALPLPMSNRTIRRSSPSSVRPFHRPNRMWSPDRLGQYSHHFFVFTPEGGRLRIRSSRSKSLRSESPRRNC